MKRPIAPAGRRITRRGEAHDPKCYELARYCLGSEASDRLVANLAQAIADEIESWIKHEKDELARG
jgi:hypothetical protein